MTLRLGETAACTSEVFRDHISIPIVDAARTGAFYTACLAPLGWVERGYRQGRYVGFHKDGEPVLYFAESEAVGGSVHLAFQAPDHQAVRDSHDRALNAGGADNGAPGPRPGYGPDYFAAFVLDPDGHNIEAVVGGVR